MNFNNSLKAITVAVCLFSLVAGGEAQNRRHRRHHKRVVHHRKTVVRRVATGVRASSSENSLVGIKLYDSGTRVVTLYGTPDEIQAISVGGSSVGPTGGGGAPGPGGPAGRGGGGGGKLGGGGGALAPAGWTGPEQGLIGDPFDMGPTNINQSKGGGFGVAPEGGGGGPAPSAGGGGGGGRLGGGGGGGGQATNNVAFTRWVYRRGPSKYGFVMDNHMRVVQIEAIGLNDPRARTRRGIGFGATFAQIIKKYNAPDGYEIGGDNLMVRYLQRAKVAFRMNRLAPNKPHQVTGIVVAAGKA